MDADLAPRPMPPPATLGLLAIQAGVLILVGVLTPLANLASWGGDPFYYLEAGRAFLGGGVPYRDFAFAYPPLAILPMALPHLLAGGGADSETYRWCFLLQNVVISTSIAVCLLRLAARGDSVGAQVGYLLPLVAIAPLVAWRFDILVSLLVVLALVATAEGRPGLAGLALGLGALTKVVPAFLVPILVAYHLANHAPRAAGRVVAAFLLTVAAVMGPLVLFAGPSALSFVEFQQARGVEIESSVAGMALLAHLAFGTPVEVGYGFNSWQIVSPLADVLAAPLPIILGVLLGLLVGISFRRFGDGRLAQPSGQTELLHVFLLAAVLVVILTNKVFSPQYLVWLLPLAALRPLREAILVALIAALSIVTFPLNWPQLLGLDPGMILLVNARNVLLVAWLVWLIWPQRRGEVAGPGTRAELRAS